MLLGFLTLLIWGQHQLAALTCDERCVPELRSKCDIFKEFPSAAFFFRDSPGLTPQLMRRRDEFENCTAASIVMAPSGLAGWKGGFVNDIGTPLQLGAGLYDGYLAKGAWFPPVSFRLEDLKEYIRADAGFAWNDVLPLMQRIVTFDGAVKAIPADGDFIHYLVREDLLERHSKVPPETLEEWVELGEFFNGKDLNEDGTPDFGFCNMYQATYTLGGVAMSFFAAVMQTLGTSQGVFFETKTMNPLWNTQAGIHVLGLYKRFLDAGTWHIYLEKPDLVEDVGDTPTWLSGRCAIIAHFPGPLKHFARASVERSDPATGAMLWQTTFTNGTLARPLRQAFPGSTKHMDPATGMLVECSEASCPHAEVSARSGRRINSAPFMATGGYALVIAKSASNPRKQVLFNYFAYLTSPVASLEDVGIGHMDAFRYSHIVESARSSYQAAGWFDRDIDFLFKLVPWALSHPNGAMDMSMEKEDEYQTALINGLVALGSGANVADVAAQLNADFDSITDSGSRISQLASYRASLSLGELDSETLCKYHLNEATSLYGPDKCAGFISCVAGEGYDFSVGSCMPCPAGQFALAGKDGCRNCTAGTFRNATMPGDTCALARAGFVVESAGATSATACSPGTSSANSGSTACSACDIGGFHQAAAGQTQCERCDKGSYAVAGVPASACTSCPAGRTTESSASSGVADCVCPAGLYQPLGSPACIRCPEGMSCTSIGSDERNIPLQHEAVRGAFPAVQPGYMTLAEGRLAPYKCRPADLCPGGPAAACAEHRDPSAVGCSKCAEGFYSGGDGKCLRCSSGKSAMLWILAFLALAVGLALAAGLVSRNTVAQTSSESLIVLTAGIFLTAYQTLSVFDSLLIEWTEPLKSTLEAVTVVAFNFDVLSPACAVGQRALGIYSLRVAAIPVCLCYIVAVTCAKLKLRKERRDKFVQHVANGLGMTCQVILVPVILTVVSPFACYRHPGSVGASMLQEPSVLCFEDPEHSGLVAVGVAAFLICVLPYLAMNTWAVLRHRRLLNDSVEAQVHLSTFRFLFFRFRSETYWFSLVALLRSLSVCLVPVVIQDSASSQRLVMFVVLQIYLVTLLAVRPWRLPAANLMDGITTAFLTFVLQCSTLSGDVDNNGQALGVLGTIALVVFTVLVIVRIGVSACRYMRPPLLFGYFLCHYKVEAGATARYFQMMISEKSSDTCFLDSDNLVDLETLFDTVRCSIGRLVVIMTPNVLRRPWCAGEIAVTAQTHRRIFNVEMTNFEPPVQFTAEAIPKYLAESNFRLTDYGITDAVVADAFNWALFADTDKVTFPVDAVGRARFLPVVGAILKAGTRPGSIMASSATSQKTKQTGELSKDSLVISTRPSDDESTACAGIVVLLLQAEIVGFVPGGIAVLDDHAGLSADGLLSAVQHARVVLVMFAEGSLQSEQQLSVIYHSVEAQKPLVPVILPGFQFPLPSFRCSASVDDKGTTHEVHLHVRAVFKIIAVAFPSHGSLKGLSAQVESLILRIPKVKTVQKYASLTECSAGAGEVQARQDANLQQDCRAAGGGAVVLGYLEGCECERV